MTRMRCPAAASAVARLTAVVVLPTPPFWLATAMMRARPEASRAVSLAIAASLTAIHPADPRQTQNDPPRVAATVVACDVHCPSASRRGQFLPCLFALWEEAYRIRSDKPFCQRQKSVEPGATARGDHIDRMRRNRFDSRIADFDR